ncbi:serine proteinase stubble-like [Anopheles marshallii]|uniref:serine proteinase stubble-like n=1 Tax=Anopheles marshallii TaxID=1521116 RepID=UPI00237C4BA0|nr:serine proteinase stubble-like [Anopheles marshallii]
MSGRWRFVVNRAVVVMLLVGHFPTIQTAVIGNQQQPCTTSSNKAGYCMPSCPEQEIVDLRTSASCTGDSRYCCPIVDNNPAWRTKAQYTECDSNRGYCVKNGMCSVPTYRFRSNRCPSFEEICCPKGAFQEESISTQIVITTASSTTTTTTTTTVATSDVTTTATTPAGTIMDITNPELVTSSMTTIKMDSSPSTTPISTRPYEDCIECEAMEPPLSTTATSSDSQSITGTATESVFSTMNPTSDWPSSVTAPTTEKSDTISNLLQQFRPENFTYQHCGQRNPHGVVESTIDQDSRAEYGEIPWMVALLQLPDKRYCCNGALIEKNAILTTAHCITNCGGWASEIVVRVGEWDMRSTAEQVLPRLDIGVKRVHLHGDYVKSSLINNIALLVLNESVQYQATVQPVCLPSAEYKLRSRENMIATGWGAMVEANATLNQTLKRLDLQSVETSICKKELKTEERRAFDLHHSFVCADINHKEKERPCIGDAGSPVVVEIPGMVDRYYLHGLVSWGYGCNQSRITYIVLTHVGHFRNWIDGILQSMVKKNRKGNSRGNK